MLYLDLKSFFGYVLCLFLCLIVRIKDYTQHTLRVLVKRPPAFRGLKSYFEQKRQKMYHF